MSAGLGEPEEKRGRAPPLLSPLSTHTLVFQPIEFLTFLGIFCQLCDLNVLGPLPRTLFCSWLISLCPWLLQDTAAKATPVPQVPR